MTEHSVETLVARYDQLQADASFDQWRQLSQDVLKALVEQQGLVIAMQRRALDAQRDRSEDRAMLRMHAEAAFTLVQQLHQLRRKVHALLPTRRAAASEIHRFARAS